MALVVDHPEGVLILPPSNVMSVTEWDTLPATVAGNFISNYPYNFKTVSEILPGFSFSLIQNVYLKLQKHYSTSCNETRQPVLV